MKRRVFLAVSARTSAAALAGAPLAAAASPEPVKSINRSKAKIGAYYLGAQTYTFVPSQIRQDMEWMADKGTDYVCPALLEQDLFAAYENHALIAQEAKRVGMEILAVPSRWGGLTAGAPAVPSLFTILNPQTWRLDENGSSAIHRMGSGAISSVHHPDTLKFFCDTLAEMYKQHPEMAGFIIDEPQFFGVDRSPAAVAVLGRDAPMAAHYAAARDFFGKVCAFAKQKWPDKLTLLFLKAHYSADLIAVGAAVPHLDYYGADGRPWGLEDDNKMRGSGVVESGKGKILLSGRGESFIRAARQQKGRKSFFLVENHNLRRGMIEPMDRNYPAVLALGADLYLYYYYPVKVQEPDRAMHVVGRHIKAFTQGR